MLKIIDVMLEKKSMQGELNGYDHNIIRFNFLRNIFILSENHNYTYENNQLLTSALAKTQLLGDDWKNSSLTACY